MIEKILQEINEDKHTNPATTSNNFKRDLWDFCIEMNLNGLAVEFGTHKGQTTRVLSYLFDKVYTFNLPGNFDKAKEINQDRDNIQYIGVDLYKTSVNEEFFTSQVSLFLIDAGHSTDNVLTDFTRAINMPLSDTVYFVFDDYGLIYDVKTAIDSLIQFGKLEIIREIGQPQGYDFKNGRILQLGSEGLICKLIKD